MSHKETATVTTACEVSFAMGNMNYGTITVPVGTKVFRHVIKSRDAAWKPETVKVSDWFVEYDAIVKLCPESSMIGGKPSSFYLHDASHYGITMPNANVFQTWRSEAVAKHKVHHY